MGLDSGKFGPRLSHKVAVITVGGRGIAVCCASLVEVAPVSYLDHENFAGIVVYLIAHPPISHADSPNAFFASHLKARRRYPLA
jgi:hypothetical protein